MRKQPNHKKELEGQILIIVLIVMLILGITIVAVTNTIIQDSIQSEQNIKYETLYAISESHIQNLAISLPISEEIVDLSSEVSNVLTETGFSSSCVTDPLSPPNDNGVVCDIIDTSLDSNQKLKVKVADSPDLRDIELTKGENVIYKLNPSDPLQVATINLSDFDTNNLALEVILDFKYSDLSATTQYSSVRGVYDLSSGSIFSDTITNDFFTFTSTGGPNQFTLDITTVVTNVINSSNFSSNFIDTVTEPFQLRFKPLISTSSIDEQPSITLSVTTPNPGNFTQSRKFEATAYEETDGDPFGGQAFVVASVAAYKTPNIFDYILRSGGDI